MLDLSARNLQLSNENAELNSRLHSDQGTVQMLTERLSQVCREQEETTVFIKQLQETNRSLGKEKLQLQASKQDEKTLLERALIEAKDKVFYIKWTKHNGFIFCIYFPVFCVTIFNWGEKREAIDLCR